MKLKAIKERTCIGCRVKMKKEEMARFYKEGRNYFYDRTGKKEGRGLYICRDISCIEKAKKNRKYSIDENEICILKKDVLQNEEILVK